MFGQYIAGRCELSASCHCIETSGLECIYDVGVRFRKYIILSIYIVFSKYEVGYINSYAYVVFYIIFIYIFICVYIRV